MSVDIIMPANNAVKFIGAAIESVLEQSHSNLRLLVVDDGSTDNTVDVVTKFVTSDVRVILIELETQSGGPSKPRNRALQHIEADFVAFIDADDIWHSEKLRCQIQTMLTHRLDFTSCEHIKFANEFGALPAEVKALTPLAMTLIAPAVTMLSHEKILRKNKVVCSGVVMRADLAKQVSFSEDYVGVEDYLAWLILLQNASVRAAIINAPLVFYRLRRDSLSNSKVQMARKIYRLLSNYSQCGQPLGNKKYFYFTHYVFAGLKILICDKLNRKF